MMREVAVLILVLTAACTPSPRPPGTTPATSTTSAATTAPPATTATTRAAPAAVCLAGEGEFVANGTVGNLDRPAGDARLVQQLGWDTHQGCERFVVAFGTEDGAPAVAPPSVAATLRRQPGVLRLSLGPEVVGSVVADQLVESELVSRVYVVRALDGSLFLDLHLAEPAEARVEVASSPARVLVDLRPGGPRFAAPPTASNNVVVVEPLPGSISYPFSALGYVRTGENSITGSVRQGGETVAEASSPLAEQSDTWGAFVLLFPSGPAGSSVLMVADVEIPLVVG